MIIACRCYQALFQENKVVHRPTMLIEFDLRLLTFGSESPYFIFSTTCKYVLVLHYNESINDSLMIIKVSAVVMHFLFVVPHSE